MAALLGAGGAAPLLARVAAAQHLLAGAGAGGQTAAGAGHQVAAGEGRGVQPEGAGAARFVAQVPAVELSTDFAKLFILNPCFNRLFNVKMLICKKKQML